MKIIRPLVLLFLIITIVEPALSKDKEPSFRIQSIEKSLLKKSNGVIRNSQTDVTFKGEDEILIENETVVTILNGKAMKEGPFIIPYDNFSEVIDIEGTIFDENGDKVRALKKEEIYDVSANANYELFNDFRYKIVTPYYSRFPFTYRFKYKINIKGFIKPPSWQVIRNPGFSIEAASLTVHTSAAIKLLYNDYNVLPVSEQLNDSKKKYSWVVNNYFSATEENNLPDSMEIYPKVDYFPELFTIDGNTGSYKSWADFGYFYSQLNANSNLLNTQAKNEIDQLVTNITDAKTKIKIIYQWMQSQTRYVSIQKGIGGWKSFDAKYVYEKKFGDCKALVNYVQAALNHLSIKSFPVLLAAGTGKGYFNVKLPCNYFNHVILCIPLMTDTLWLECTSNTQPFNYLGSFTSNRFGLLINDTASKLVKTPDYGLTANIISLSATVQIDTTGQSKCVIKQMLNGETQDEARIVDAKASVFEKEDWIRKQIAVADYELKKYTINSLTLDTAFSILEFELNSHSLSAISGQRLFIHPKILFSQLDKIKSHAERIYPFELTCEMTESDSIRIVIPENFIPETNGKKEVFSCEFGEFNYTLNFDPSRNVFIYKDFLVIRKKIINKDKYNEWMEFKEKVDLVRNSTIVCIKK